MTKDISIILVQPQMGENIGAAARVMKNFGFTDLRLIAPRDGWPNEKAMAMAANAADIVESASLFNHVEEAIADRQKIYGTTARDRAMNKPVYSPREVMETLPSDQKTAILFGPERTGLENEVVSLCHGVISIDVNPEYPSLNLAQAVAVIAYECASHQPKAAQIAPCEQANMQEVQGFYQQLETLLDAHHFWKVEEKKPQMWRNIRNIFQRIDLTSQEVRTLRGILSALHHKTS